MSGQPYNEYVCQSRTSPIIKVIEPVLQQEVQVDEQSHAARLLLLRKLSYSQKLYAESYKLLSQNTVGANLQDSWPRSDSVQQLALLRALSPAGLKTERRIA